MKKITKISLIAACFLGDMAFSHGSVEAQSSSSRFERFLARYGYNSLGEKVSADQQPQAAVAAQSVAQMAKTSNSQPTAKVTAQVAQIPVSSAAPSSRFERFLARYGYNSLGEKVSADQQPQAAVAAQSVAQMAKTSNSQPTAKVTAQVAQIPGIFCSSEFPLREVPREIRL
ncbi:MAG: hypothetical protein LW808_000455 [Verrucomicrobiota bacterium]|nr:MAG: hypothetical protein LW808_000455 [Verrucomicrobiota bacterium]